MQPVFVHGNPETAAIWEPLLSELGRNDALALSPPGFGVPVPEGFGCTAVEYVTWLTKELETIGEPVDLVGHDWGSNYVIRLACERPELIRSWCGDTAGCFAPNYEWNAASKIWMTPGEGEKAIAAQLAMGAERRVALYGSLGMTPAIATKLSEAFDDAMGQSILNVYRSVHDVWEEWRDGLGRCLR